MLPPSSAAKMKTPRCWGVKQNKIGAAWYPSHRPMVVDRESPLLLGGNNSAQTRWHVISCRLVLWKNPPQTMGEDKSSNWAVCGLHTARSHLEGQTKWCVGCTLPCWKVERGSVWDARRLVCIWKAEWDSMWVAHRLAGIWKVKRGSVWDPHHLTGL